MREHLNFQPRTCSLRQESSSLLEDKDNANPLKKSAQPLSTLILYSKSCTIGTASILVSSGQSLKHLIITWRCGAVCSQHSLLHTLFALLRLTPETCVVGHALLNSGITSCPVDSNGRIKTSESSFLKLFWKIESKKKLRVSCRYKCQIPQILWYNQGSWPFLVFRNGAATLVLKSRGWSHNANSYFNLMLSIMIWRNILLTG